MPALLTNSTTDQASTIVALNGPCVIHGAGVFDGAVVNVQLAAANDAAQMAPPSGAPTALVSPGSFAVNGQGDYYLRVVQQGSGANTNITITSTP